MLKLDTVYSVGVVAAVNNVGRNDQVRTKSNKKRIT